MLLRTGSALGVESELEAAFPIAGAVAPSQVAFPFDMVFHGIERVLRQRELSDVYAWCEPDLLLHVLLEDANNFREDLVTSNVRNYITVAHVSGRRYLLRQTMTTLARSLDPARFERVHRSTIVNREMVAEIRRGGVLVLRSGDTVQISRARRKRRV